MVEGVVGLRTELEFVFLAEQREVFTTARSTFRKCGPRSSSRLPVCRPVGAENAANAAAGFLNNWIPLLLRLGSVCGSTCSAEVLPLKIGYAVFPNVVVEALSSTGKAKPVCQV